MGCKKVSKKQRERVIKRDGYICQNPQCNHNLPLSVHHTKPNSDRLKDLITLCRPCHDWVESIKCCEPVKRGRNG